MMQIPNHQPGHIFTNSADELRRSHRIVCVARNGGPYDTGQLAIGFFKAAHQLLLWDVPPDHIEALPIEARSALDSALDLKIYPILYCYRHAIELALKHLLFQVPRIFKEELTPRDLEGHPLEKWWKKLRPFLDRLRAEAAQCFPRHAGMCRCLQEDLDPAKISNVESVILEIHDLDKSSTTLRYALDKSGQIPLGQRQHVILDKLFRFVLPLHIWFEGVIYRCDELAGPTPGLEPTRAS